MTAVQDADQLGRTRMVTLITLFRRFGWVQTRIVFLVSHFFPSLLAIGPMKMVHVTHWSILRSIPYNGPPQVPERLPRPAMIWGSFWGGAFDPYIEAFVQTVQRQIVCTWGGSVGWRGTARRVATLTAFIDASSWTGAHAYSAYPDATVRDIDAAMRIVKEHPALVASARSDSPAQFARNYEGFLARVGADL